MIQKIVACQTNLSEDESSELSRLLSLSEPLDMLSVVLLGGVSDEETASYNAGTKVSAQSPTKLVAFNLYSITFITLRIHNGKFYEIRKNFKAYAMGAVLIIKAYAI